MSLEIIGLLVGAAIIVIETIILAMLVHHLRKLNEHTMKLDFHVKKLDTYFDELHEHAHYLEKNVDRLCSCVLPSEEAEGN
ncbi:MAG: hypothetical protein JSV84_08880 [Gemmatimonadota bacterium]|nr:MAG: hypothetical protein JSV84_08880 [Gemmatimonadota bacterium]